MQANADLRECILKCRECSEECHETLINICLPKGGKHVEAEHVRMMLDCIQICQMSADFMTRNSPHHFDICNVCAEICEACAESCEALGEEMQVCVEACRTCANSCREMSEMKKAA